MCSGARSSSAKAAMAWRASVACSWSTSSRMVLSLWTIRGPSFIGSVLSLVQFLCRFDIDDPVDGEHALCFLVGIEHPHPASADGDGENCFPARITHAVHNIHRDRLFQPYRFLQGLQPKLGDFLTAGGGGETR